MLFRSLPPLVLNIENRISGTDDPNPNGVEILVGTVRNDLIEGFGGNDKIDGGAGDDYIVAGAGQDVFVLGGSGADIFEFGIGDELIKIADWEDGIDKIHLRDGLTLADLTIYESNYQGIASAQLWLDEDGDGVMDSRLVLGGFDASVITPDDFV